MLAHRLDREPLLAARHDVGDETFFRSGRVGTRHHHHLAHGGMRREHVFDFAELDAEAADFHLIVDAAKVVEVAVGQAAREIAGAVELAVGRHAERIGHETLRGQFGPVQVADRQADAGDVQFSGHADGREVAAGIEHQERRVHDRLADEAAAALVGIGAPQRPIRHVHRRLRDAIHVDELRARLAMPLEPRAQMRKLQRFAAKDHMAQGECAGVGHVLLGLHQLTERGRRLVKDRHALADQQLAERGRRAAREIRHDHQASAVEERAPDFPDREIECHRVENRPHIRRVETEPHLGRSEEPQDVAMRDHAALRPAGGAGRIDDVGRILRRGDARQRRTVLAGIRPQRRRVEFQPQHLRVAQTSGQPGRGDDDRHAAVLEREVEAVVGIDRIERHVGAAGLQDAKQRDDQRRIAFEEEADERAALHAERAQAVRNGVGGAVEFGVGQRAGLRRHRDSLGGVDGLAREPRVQAAVAQIFGWRDRGRSREERGALFAGNERYVA